MKKQFEPTGSNTNTHNFTKCRAYWMVSLAKTMKYETQRQLANAMKVSRERVTYLNRRAVALGLLREGELKVLMATARMNSYQLAMQGQAK